MEEEFGLFTKQDAQELIDRFIRYCKIDTQSAFDVEEVPSTQKQFDLAKLLQAELEAIGIKTKLTDHCILYGTIEETAPTKEVLGLATHMDVSPDAPSANVKPIIHRQITGGDLALPSGVVISSADLQKYAGQDIITSDGTTLLGADDKSGVAAVMQLATILQREKEKIPHGKIALCFTPDEEVGTGVEAVDVKEWGADVAYTVDGATIGEYEDENFNAESCTVTVEGHLCWFGVGYGKLINAVAIASEFMAMLPQDKKPETTSGRQGFIHVTDVNGATGKATVDMILRDFTEEGISEQKRIIEEIAEQLRKKHPKAKISVTTKRSYSNMKQYIDKHPELLTRLESAMKQAGVTPKPSIIRGGSDGSELCEMGVPTPNMFAGGENFHSIREFVPIPSLLKTCHVLLALIPQFI